MQGNYINYFFSDSHLAPKFSKVVVNSKKLAAIFKDKVMMKHSSCQFGN